LTRDRDSEGTPHSPQTEATDDDVLVVDQPEQLKALGSPVRRAILIAVAEQSASITQLAKTLKLPKSTVNHHVAMLEKVGLLRVVGTRRVRAVTESFYGRAARHFHVRPLPGEHAEVDAFLQQVIAQARPTPFDDDVPQFSLAYARVPEDVARRYAEEIAEVVRRFKSEPRQGDVVFGVVAGLFLGGEASAAVPDAGEKD
jgi:DNA-binding transcriptional ArsR family regulator